MTEQPVTTSKLNRVLQSLHSSYKTFVVASCLFVAIIVSLKIVPKGTLPTTMPWLGILIVVMIFASGIAMFVNVTRLGLLPKSLYDESVRLVAEAEHTGIYGINTARMLLDAHFMRKLDRRFGIDPSRLALHRKSHSTGRCRATGTASSVFPETLFRSACQSCC